MNKFLLIAASMLTISISNAQTDSAKSNLTISGYLETYYLYDFNNPADHNRPSFIYSHNRHNEFNVNLGFIKANYDDGKVRGNLALAVGTYMNANYAAEPGVLKNIFEANAGVKISENKNLWVDAGIFASHIGFESAIGKDCWNMTRSILAENSPYFETGAKISYTSDNGKWFLSGLVLNGWQQITKNDNNQRIALGTQITFKPSDKVTLNSSTYFGGSPDSNAVNRYFHNFYGIFQVTEKLGVTVGFDYGVQQQGQGADNYNNWYSPVLILKYALFEKVTLAARVENYTDKKGVVIGSQDFNTNGYSLNLDISPVKNVVWRLEGRLLDNKEKFFTDADSQATNTSTFVGTSLAISF
jgi:hypothetical protein